MSDAKTYRRLTTKERASMFRLIEEHCNADADGMAVYDEGWSDDRVVTEMHKDPSPPPLIHQSVLEARRELIGPVRKRRAEPAQTHDIEALQKLLFEQAEQTKAMKYEMACQGKLIDKLNEAVFGKFSPAGSLMLPIGKNGASHK